MDKKMWIKILAAQAAATIILMLAAVFPWVNVTYSNEELEKVTEECVKSPNIILGYGTYKYTIEYETHADTPFAFLEMQSVNEHEDGQEKQLIGHMDMDVVYLTSDRNYVTGEAFVRMPAKDYAIYAYRFADADLTVNSVTVQKTVGGMLKTGIVLTTVFGIIDLIMEFADRRKKGLVKEGSVEVFFILTGTIMFTSIPLSLGYLVNGHDLQYHLLRIEGIKDGLLAGDFPIKIQPNWLNGNGYATSVFYGDLFIYIPAILRLCGFSVQQSYNIYVLLCNIATCMISYFCFKGISGRRKTAVIGAAIYTTSIYRLLDMYVRSSVGEYSAMTFLPLIAYGLWKIYTEDCDGREYEKNWIILVLGFTGIINTHILTCEMVAIFTILLCLIFAKKTFRKRRFIVLLKTVIYTTILNLAFFVPFFHYMLFGNFVITSNSPKYIQQYGAFLGQIFTPVMTYSGLTKEYQSGAVDELPLTTGLGLIVGAAVLVYSFAKGYVREKKEKAAGIVLIVFAAMSIWLSTYHFPWDAIQNICHLFKKIVSTLQFPWRFLSMACIMLALCAVLALKSMNLNKKAYKYAAIVMLALSFIQAGYLMGSVINTYEPLYAYSESKLDTNMVIGSEYLPAGVLVEMYDKQYVETDENVECIQNYRKNNYIDCTLKNDSAADGIAMFSLVYYDGYSAVDKNTGEKLTVSGKEGRLCVNVPSNYSGDVVISFTGFAAWRIAAIISLISAVIFVIYIVDKEKVIIKSIKRQKK